MSIEIKTWDERTLYTSSSAGSLAEALTEAIAARVSLQGADLANEDLTGADLSKGFFFGAEFTESVLHGVNFQGAVLEGASLRNAQLDEANLRGANCYTVDATNATFRHADLRGAGLASAWLGKTDFFGSSLAGADLKKSTLQFSDLRGTDLEGVRVSSSDFTSALFPSLGLSFSAGPLGHGWILPLDSRGCVSRDGEWKVTLGSVCGRSLEDFQRLADGEESWPLPWGAVEQTTLVERAFPYLQAVASLCQAHVSYTERKRSHA